MSSWAATWRCRRRDGRCGPCSTWRCAADSCLEWSCACQSLMQMEEYQSELPQGVGLGLVDLSRYHLDADAVVPEVSPLEVLPVQAQVVHHVGLEVGGLRSRVLEIALQQLAPSLRPHLQSLLTPLRCPFPREGTARHHLRVVERILEGVALGIGVGEGRVGLGGPQRCHFSIGPLVTGAEEMLDVGLLELSPLEALGGGVDLVLEVGETLLEIFMNDGFAQDLLVQLHVEFDVKGLPFRLQAAAEGVVDQVGRHPHLALALLHTIHNSITSTRLPPHSPTPPLPHSPTPPPAPLPSPPPLCMGWLSEVAYNGVSLTKMLKLITVAWWIWVVAGGCAPQCYTCSADSSPYACLSCLPDNRDMFLWSCPTPPSSSQMAPYIAIAAIVTLLHLFLLAMGIGVYRDVFQNLQLCSLISWRYGFEGGSVALQATNLAVARHNSFPDTFGAQFIVVMCILGVFWLLLLLVERIPHSPTAVLVRRKKIIFPTRVITFIFNILVFSSVAQISTANTEPTFKLFALVLAILALMKALMVLVGLAVTSNWQRFQVDDPHYYVLLEEMTSKKWYAKNNVLFSLVARGSILTVFASMFRVPEIAGIIMLIIQVLYAFYVIALLRFTKLRYYIIIVCANILTVALLLLSYVGSLATIGSDSWRKESTGYVVVLLLMAALCFLGSCGEILARREVIVKQLRSICDRFICCNRLEDKVNASKYDENSHRERVTEFNKNLLYQRDLPEQTIELTSTSSRSNQ